MACSYCKVSGHNRRTCSERINEWCYRFKEIFGLNHYHNIHIPSDKELMLEQLIEVLQRGINNGKMTKK